MANRNKNKGTYHEKWFVKWLEEAGIKAKRQPLRQFGGEIQATSNSNSMEKNWREK